MGTRASTDKKADGARSPLFHTNPPNRFRMVGLLALGWMSCGWSSAGLLAQQPSQENASSHQSQDVSARDAESESAEKSSDSEEVNLLPEIAQAMVKQTNAFRQGNDAVSLSVDEELTKTAEKFAKYMAVNDKYGHGADGRTPAERAKASGYAYCVVRENIAFRRGSELEDHRELTETFVQGWIDSDEHRENMMADYITETGVAVATSDQSTFYAVQMFGRPKSLRFQVQLTNETEEMQELTLEHDGDTDSFELPPRVRLKVSRCLPTNFTLNEGKETLTLKESAKLAIVTDAEKEAELRRVDSSDQ